MSILNKKISLCLLLMLVGLSQLVLIDMCSADEISFIVNAESSLKEVSQQDLVDIFLKKKREWADGSSIRFIDRKEGTTVKNLFLNRYLNRSGRDVELYWIGQKLYSGNAAPIQVSTDQVAESLVSSFKGGMSYISADYVPGKGVKKISIQGSKTF